MLILKRVKSIYFLIILASNVRIKSRFIFKYIAKQGLIKLILFREIENPVLACKNLYICIVINYIMNNNFFFFRFKAVSLSILFILIASFAISQKSIIEIRQAKKLTGIQVGGVSLQILQENVILIHDETIFHCDSARLNKTMNMFNAFGNIYALMKDSVQLYGDRLIYNGNTKIVEIFNNVKLIDDSATLTTDYLIYNRLSKIGIYNTGGKIVDSTNVLESKIGHFYTDTDEYYFQDSVVVTNDDYVIRTDTLYYNSKTNIVHFYGPTTLTSEKDFMFALSGWSDTKKKITSLKNKALLRHDKRILKGDSIYYDELNDYGLVFNNGSMLDPEKEIIIKGHYLDYKYSNKNYAYALDSSLAILYNNEDSLFLHADTLKIQFNDKDETERLFAYYNAKFYKKDMQGVCDSLIYEMMDSTIKMLQNPIVWSEGNQLTADSMFIFISNNKPDSLNLIGSAFISSEDTLQAFNQISGRNIYAFFKESKLSKVNVNGNSETVYYIRDDDSKEIIGINKAVSSNMVIRFKNQEINNILYVGHPKATMYPESTLPMSDRSLSGFSWHSTKRPKSRDDIYSSNPQMPRSNPEAKNEKSEIENQKIESEKQTTKVKRGRLDVKKKNTEVEK